jgi:hypothetical protein
MDALPPASGPRFAICPLCEERKLVFSGWYSARCPACGYELEGAFLRTLRQIATLPDVPETSHDRPDRDPERR